MYVILVYDCGVERVNDVRKFLKQYLSWVQNSVFEGELTDAEFMKVKATLKAMIKHDYDSIRIYKLRSDKYLDVEQLGVPPDLENII